MPFYVELDDAGRRIDKPDLYWNPPLEEGEIPKLPDGSPRYRLVEIVYEPFDEMAFKSIGFRYEPQIDGNYKKRELVVPLTNEEVAAKIHASRAESIEGALPHWTDTDFLLFELIKGLYDWKEAQFDHSDPTYAVGEPDSEMWAQLEEILRLHKAGRGIA